MQDAKFKNTLTSWKRQKEQNIANHNPLCGDIKFD